jgi:hypothetical protein
MAPEQMDGERVDARADVYSLGVVLFELVTGERPYAAADRWKLHHAVLSGKRKRISETVAVPRELETVVGRALAPAREARYATASDLARDLEAVLAGRPVEGAPRRIPPLLAGLVVLSSALAIAFAVTRTSPRPELAPAPMASPAAANGSRTVAVVASTVKPRGDWHAELATANQALEDRNDVRAKTALEKALELGAAGKPDAKPIAAAAIERARAKADAVILANEADTLRRAIEESAALEAAARKLAPELDRTPATDALSDLPNHYLKSLRSFTPLESLREEHRIWCSASTPTLPASPATWPARRWTCSRIRRYPSRNCAASRTSRSSTPRTTRSCSACTAISSPRPSPTLPPTTPGRCVSSAKRSSSEPCSAATPTPWIVSSRTRSSSAGARRRRSRRSSPPACRRT